MLLNDRDKFEEMLITLFDAYNKKPTDSQFDTWFSLMEEYDIQDIRHAMSKYAKSEKYPPVPASVIEYIPGLNKISADEAWAHMPKSERDSAYVNHRMMTAFGVASELLDTGDTIAARKAFIDTYNNQPEDGEWFWTQPEGMTWEQKQLKKSEDYSKIVDRQWMKNTDPSLMIENGSKQTKIGSDASSTILEMLDSSQNDTSSEH